MVKTRLIYQRHYKRFVAQSKQIHHLFFSLLSFLKNNYLLFKFSRYNFRPSLDSLELFKKKHEILIPLNSEYKIIPRNMEVSLPPAKSPLVGRTNKPERKFPASPRFQRRDSSPHVSRRPMRTTATSHYSLRKVHGSANKEIIKRALTPPARRPTLRWLDFKPTPSRLCNMSAA